MKIKLTLATFFVAIFAAFMFLQLNAVRAVASTTNIAPVTSPVTFYSISGKVEYIFKKILSGAENVQISAVDNLTGVVFKTYTNQDGTYSLSVPQGTYSISASDNTHTRFSPKEKTVVIDSTSVSGIDFVGHSK